MPWLTQPGLTRLGHLTCDLPAMRPPAAAEPLPPLPPLPTRRPARGLQCRWTQQPSPTQGTERRPYGHMLLGGGGGWRWPAGRLCPSGLTKWDGDHPPPLGPVVEQKPRARLGRGWCYSSNGLLPNSPNNLSCLPSAPRMKIQVARSVDRTAINHHVHLMTITL